MSHVNIIPGKITTAMASIPMSGEGGQSSQCSAPAPQINNQAPAGSTAAPSSQLPGHASFRRYAEIILSDTVHICADILGGMKTTSFTSLPSTYIHICSISYPSIRVPRSEEQIVIAEDLNIQC